MTQYIRKSSKKNPETGTAYAFPEWNAGVMYVGMSVCIYVRTRNSKTIAPIDSIFFTRSTIPVVRSSSKMILIGSRIWTQ